VRQIELDGTVWWIPDDEHHFIYSQGSDSFRSLIGFLYFFRSQRNLQEAISAIQSIRSGAASETAIGSGDFCVYFYSHHAATGLDNVAELIFLWEKENFRMMPIDAFDNLINRLQQLRPTSEPSPITTRIYDISSEYRRPDSVYEYDDYDED